MLCSRQVVSRIPALSFPLQRQRPLPSRSGDTGSYITKGRIHITPIPLTSKTSTEHVATIATSSFLMFRGRAVGDRRQIGTKAKTTRARERSAPPSSECKKRQQHCRHGTRHVVYQRMQWRRLCEHSSFGRSFFALAGVCLFSSASQKKRNMAEAVRGGGLEVGEEKIYESRQDQVPYLKLATGCTVFSPAFRLRSALL